MFALQDDLVPRIVSTVADWYGVLPHSMSEAVRLKPIDQLTPYEALLRSFGYFERVVPAEHAAARSALERAVQQAPGDAEIWAMLSMLYGEEYRFGFNATPDPLGRSLQAARRATAAAPSSHYGHLAMAQALFFRKEFDAFRNAAERAIALNPMDGSEHGVPGPLAGVCRRLGAGLRAGGEGAAAEPASRRVVLGRFLPRRLSQGRLHDRAQPSCSRPTCQGSSFHGRCSQPCTASSESARRRKTACETCWRSSPTSRRSSATSSRSGTRRPGRTADRRTAQGGARCRRRDGLANAATAPARFGRNPGRRGLLGCSAAVHVAGSGSGNNGAGGRVVRRDRHRAVALFLPPSDWSRFDRTLLESDGRPADRRERGRRAIRDGRQPATGGIDTTGGRTAGGREHGRASVGGNVRSAVSCGRCVRVAGRTDAAHRFHRRGSGTAPWCTA